MIPLAVFVLLIFAYGLLSHRLERTIITGPMVFTVVGIFLFFATPGLSEEGVKTKAVLVASEIALAVILFTDATRIPVRDLIGSANLPGRLLGIGMPLTILGGTLVAWFLLPELTIWEAAILGTILAPTDAGLGHAVLSSKRVPLRIRQALNVEAGLNDGLAVPFLMLFIGLAQVTEPSQDRSWIVFTLQQIGFGLLIGLVIGFVGGWLIRRAAQRNWMASAYQQLVLLSIALFCWALAEGTGGNAFIAAFVGGLFVKVDYEGAGEQMLEFSEGWGHLLNLFVFFIFGLLAAPLLGGFGTTIVLYAILSLTVIRMLPVAVSLIKARLQPASVLFLGWFGPRGLASIVLGLIFLDEKTNLLGENIILIAVTATVLLSIFAHGISAVPSIGLYARQVQKLEPDAPELREVPVDVPLR